MSARVFPLTSKQSSNEPDDKDQTKVEYATGGLDQQLFVSRYLVALPKLHEIEQLIERDRALWERHIETNRPQPRGPTKVN